MCRASRTVVRIAALIGLSACSFAPSAVPPAVPEPPRYGADITPERTVAAQGAAQHFIRQAQPVPAWWRLYQNGTLDALIDEGLRNSPTLEAADRRLAAARDQLRASVGSAWLPSLDMVGAASRAAIPGIVEGGPDAYRYDVFAGRLEASYNFDLFGATRYANAALAARVDLQAFQFDAARRALAANIVTTVIAAAALREQIGATERLVALADELASEAQQREQAGALSLADVITARQNASTLAASLPALRQQHATAQHALAALLGRTPDHAPPDIGLADLHLPEQIPVVIPSSLLKSRPDIQAAEAALKAAASDVGAATARFFPDISLSAAFGRGGLSVLPALSGAGAIWSASAWVSQPLFHGGALVAQRKSALHTYEAAAADYRGTVLSAFADVSDALAALVHDAQALDAAHAAASDAQALAELTHARLSAGAVPASAALLGEQRWMTAKLDEIRYVSARLTDTAALFQAMGSPADIDAPPLAPAAQASVVNASP
ncbi:efflux transporter outer membrane subunit [Paraburkholderia sp. PREW-6R]|uniref:efflux transporter outer membrane subunit n=1 Tax=Paraburkholderia sp. PREW-6R TaxID=3141544 RepID=UPI0031F4A5BA